jgi:hypothetical protein
VAEVAGQEHARRPALAELALHGVPVDQRAAQDLGEEVGFDGYSLSRSPRRGQR